MTTPSLTRRMMPVALAICAVAVLASSALAVDGNFLETFATGAGGWAGGSSPTLIPTGGPSGVGDQYLQISSSSSVGNGNLATLNTTPSWTGDYAGDWMAPGEFLILGVGASMANFGSTPLSMRVIFFNTTIYRYSTTMAAEVPPDGVWRDYLWLFDPTDGSGLSSVFGDVPITTGMRDVTQVMFRHNLMPAAGGDAVTGTLGLDNIRPLPFIPAPSTAALLAVGGFAVALRRRRR